MVEHLGVCINSMPSRRLLRRVFHSQNLHSAALGQHTVKNDVVPMHHQLAHRVRQAGAPGAAKLRVLCKRLGPVAQLLAEAARRVRIVPADVGHNGTQILASLWPPLDAVRRLCLLHRSVGQLGAPCAHYGLEIGFKAQAVGIAIHTGDKGEHRYHISRNVGVQAP